MLIEYHWPGNVRELKNVIERMVVTSNGHDIGPEVIPKNLFDMSPRSESIPDLFAEKISLKQIVGEYEKKVLISLLKKTKSYNELSALLGIDRGTVRRKLLRYGIGHKFRDS